MFVSLVIFTFCYVHFLGHKPLSGFCISSISNGLVDREEKEDEKKREIERQMNIYIVVYGQFGLQYTNKVRADLSRM